MLTQFENYLTFENIYLWINCGIIPFWLLLIFMPNKRITQILVNSIVLPLILSFFYAYLVYKAILLDEPIFDIFDLYLSLENLYTVFATESFLLIFWIHFISINIFIGSWMSRDAVKHNIPRTFVFLPLVLVYFVGPIGIGFYWFFRVFFAKRLGFQE